MPTRRPIASMASWGEASTYTPSSNVSRRSTFYLDNMAPQDSMLNRGPWLRLEQLCRSVARVADEVYVVSGPLFLPEREKDGLRMRNRVLGSPPSVTWVLYQSYAYQSSSRVDGVDVGHDLHSHRYRRIFSRSSSRSAAAYCTSVASCCRTGNATTTSQDGSYHWRTSRQASGVVPFDVRAPRRWRGV